jgi:hypothetical protein
MRSVDFTEEQNELIKKFNSKQPINGVRAILTHPSCHLDEFGSIYLLQHTGQGRRIFPGIENTGVGFQTETYLRENGYLGFKGFIKALEAGYIIIGMGGGPFDEHVDRTKNISSIELVKRYLDLYASKESRSIYGQLINFINFEDNNGDNLIENLNRANPSRKLEKCESDALLNLNLGMLAQNIKKGWETAETSDDQFRLCSMVTQFIKNEIDHRKSFLAACTEYRIAERNIVDLSDNYAMVVMESDHSQMVRAVRQQSIVTGGKKLGITFVHKSNGQFILYPHNGFKDQMTEVIKILRQKIAFKRNQKGLGFDKIGENGSLWEIPELYIDENMKIIMNGSKTDPDVSGLIGQDLSVDEIIQAVTLGLDEAQFDRKFAHHCKENVCSKKIDPENKCSLFCFGLNRCKKIIENYTKEKRPFAELDKKLSKETA